MTFFHTYLLRPCLVGTGFVMFLVTVDAFLINGVASMKPWNYMGVRRIPTIM